MVSSKKKNIAIFGSSGLIGSTLREKLKSNYNIISLDKVKKNNSDISIDVSIGARINLNSFV